MSTLHFETFKPECKDAQLTDELMRALRDWAMSRHRPAYHRGDKEHWIYSGRYGGNWVWVLSEHSPIIAGYTIYMIETPASRNARGTNHAEPTS